LFYHPDIETHVHSNSEDAMRPFPLLVSSHQFRIGLQSFLAGLFPVASRREDVRDLPPHLRRDIGLDERHPPDWQRLLR
jgi:hypothetical protein